MAGPVDLATSIDSFEDELLAHVAALGLPRTGVLNAIPERVQVLNNLGGAIAALPEAYKAKSLYLSKFAMAISAGLFDAALNYLWDETIVELRRRIVDYDLNYFFDLAVPDTEKRKELEDAEDLAKITDDELIRAAATVGFISPVGQRQLDVVRFMRNHASAAHPNQLDLQSFQLLGYLQTCIAEVIMLPESKSMVDTSRLLRNVRDAKLSKGDAAGYAEIFKALPSDRIDALANGLFGIYVKLDSSVLARDNIRLLVPYLWPYIAERTRAAFGVKFGRFNLNLDQEQADLAREFLDAVGGNSYLPVDFRVAQIDKLVDRLLGAHEGWDNFYNEPPVARELQSFIGDQAVPPAVSQKYVAVLVDAYLGRHSGVAQGAVQTYEEMLDNLSPDEAAFALTVLTGANLAGTLNFAKPQRQMQRLMGILQPKLIGQPAHALDDAMRKFGGGADKFVMDTSIQAKRTAVLDSL